MMSLQDITFAHRQRSWVSQISLLLGDSVQSTNGKSALLPRINLSSLPMADSDGDDSLSDQESYSSDDGSDVRGTSNEGDEYGIQGSFPPVALNIIQSAHHELQRVNMQLKQKDQRLKEMETDLQCA